MRFAGRPPSLSEFTSMKLSLALESLISSPPELICEHDYDYNDSNPQRPRPMPFLSKQCCDDGDICAHGSSAPYIIGGPYLIVNSKSFLAFLARHHFIRKSPRR